TSLDMAGLSLTVMRLDEELEQHWLAPADAPAYRRGGTVTADHVGPSAERTRIYAPGEDPIPEAAEASQSSAARITEILWDLDSLLTDLEPELGRMDAIAG